MIFVKGECDLQSTFIEEKICSELTHLFKMKLTLITVKDFDFGRPEWNTITTPIVKAGHQWTINCKTLVWQGKLYVRLNVVKEVLTGDEQQNILMKGLAVKVVMMCLKLLMLA